MVQVGKIPLTATLYTPEEQYENYRKVYCRAFLSGGYSWHFRQSNVEEQDVVF